MGQTGQLTTKRYIMDIFCFLCQSVWHKKIIIIGGRILIDEGRSYQVYHIISFYKPSFMFRRERLGLEEVGGSIFRYHTQKETSTSCNFFLPAPRHMYLPPDTFALRSSRPQTGKTKKKKSTRVSILRYHTQKETRTSCYFFLPAPRHMCLPPDTWGNNTNTCGPLMATVYSLFTIRSEKRYEGIHYQVSHRKRQHRLPLFFCQHRDTFALCISWTFKKKKKIDSVILNR